MKKSAVKARVSGNRSDGVSFDTVREIARDLAGAEESTSYGTPAFKVKGKLFVRLHQTEDALVVGVDLEQREAMMSTSPAKFYITDHYVNYPWVLVRMSQVTSDELRDLLLGAWRRATAGKGGSVSRTITTTSGGNAELLSVTPGLSQVS